MRLGLVISPDPTWGLIEVRKEPLVVNPSPFVMDSTKVTMNLIDKNQSTFSSELPSPCRILYGTIKN